MIYVDDYAYKIQYLSKSSTNLWLLPVMFVDMIKGIPEALPATFFSFCWILFQPPYMWRLCMTAATQAGDSRRFSFCIHCSAEDGLINKLRGVCCHLQPLLFWLFWKIVLSTENKVVKSPLSLFLFDFLYIHFWDRNPLDFWRLIYRMDFYQFSNFFEIQIQW